MRTTDCTAVGGADGPEDAADKRMVSNSIKQKRMKTFANSDPPGICFFARDQPAANSDANILDNLSQPNSDRAAWILVGGRSSRMGADKARAESDGRALALRVADKAAAAVGGNVSMVGDPSLYAELGLPVVADRFPGQGPLAGIEAALAVTTCDANIIIACDMPAVRENLLEELFAAGGDCAVPQHDDGRVEPLCAVYQRRCHSAIGAALAAGTRKVTDALRLFPLHGLAIRYVRVSDPAAFANLNTPEDWRRYHHG